VTAARRPRLAAWEIALGLVGAGAIAAAVVLWIAREPPPERVILIVVDTLRRDHVSAYGGKLRTPNIDALALRGQLFANAVASFHQTTMSMASLFTGRTPSIEAEDPRSTVSWNGDTWCGLSRFAESGADESCIPEELPTLAERMRAAGYWTIGVASNQFLFDSSGFDRGFDDWSEVGDRPSDTRRSAAEPLPNPRMSRHGLLVNGAAIEALNRRPSDRFFLYVHYMDVHDYGFQRAVYAETVATVDGAVGRLLGNLEQPGLLEDAVVIFTADHGERLRERHALKGRPSHYGNPSFQELLEVPLIIAPPVVEDPARLLRTQDLFYLIQEIAGLRPGRTQELGPDELFVSERRFRTYLSGRWKSLVRRKDGEYFLFDLAADPGEKHDAADANPGVVAAHRLRLSQLSRELGVRGDRGQRELSPLERETLRILGYVE
jgi:arylsulfatase A-like enzyme